MAESTKDIINAIELEEFNDPTYRKAPGPDDDSGSVVTDVTETFRTKEGRRKSTRKTLLKIFILLTLVIGITVALACIVVFLGPEIEGGRDEPSGTRPPGPAPTVLPGVVVGDVDMSLSATLTGVNFIPAYNDPSSQEYMNFANTAEMEMMNGLQNNEDIGEYVNSVTVTGLSDGSVIVNASISISGEVASTLSSATTNTTSASDLQLLVANQVSNAANEAVMTALSNNDALGSTAVTVEVQDVSVPISANGVDLPDAVVPGEPCDDGLFRCNDGTCIEESKRCDYRDDCGNGEDELCGPCSSSQFTCENGKCIPDYYVCNLFDNCPGLDDEIGCQDGKTANLILAEGSPMTISTPTFPEPYPPHETLFWSVRTSNPDHYIHINVLDWDIVVDSRVFFDYADYFDYVYPTNAYLETHYSQWYNWRRPPRDSFTIAVNRFIVNFYPGKYGGGRGFHLEFSSVDSSGYEIEPCPAGDFQCPTDGKCIPEYWTCERPEIIVDCPDGADEVEERCALLPANGECVEGATYQFVCANGDCIHGDRRCDYRADCSDGSDEMECPCEGDKVFDCGPGDYCIPDFYVCNFDFDCRNRKDEESCGSAETTDARVLSPGQSVNFSSPNYPNDFGINVYYLFTFETDAGYQIKIDVYDFAIAIGGFVTFGNGLDPDDHDSSIDSLHHFSEAMSITSESNTLWIDIHAGPYGSGVFHASATSIEHPCGSDEFFQCNDGTCIEQSRRCDYRDDCTDGEDELCGPCSESEFTCENGKCIPDYYVCNLFDNCPGLDDEIGCQEGKTANLILAEGAPITINNPTFPEPYPPHETLFWSVRTSNPDHYIHINVLDWDIVVDSRVFFDYADYFDYVYPTNAYLETHYSQWYNWRRPPRDSFTIAVNRFIVNFYPGKYGGGRGFHLEFSSVDSSGYLIEPCPAGDFQCPTDGKCIPNYWTCERPEIIVDCPDGADEVEERCASLPANGECVEGATYQFVCANGDCIHGDRRCDYRADCSDGSDEMECPCEGDNVFDCGPGDYCIPDFYVCNFDFDCRNRKDEESCGSAETTDARVLSPGQSVDFSSPSYPDDFGINVYYLFTFETDAGYLIKIDVNDFAIAIGGYVTIGNGLDPDVHDSYIESFHHFSEAVSVTSESNTLWIDIHAGPYGSGVFHASATSIERPCEEGQFQCNDGTCVDGRCDYVDDCSEGEDELNCGPCTDSEFTCQSGKCIPDYYVCNLYDNCPDLDDEVGCAEGKTANLVLVEGSPMQISNPSYPEPYPPHDTLFWSVRTSNPDHYIRISTLDWDLVIDSQLFIEYSDYFEYVYPTNVYLEPHYTRWFDHRFKPRNFTIAVNRAMVHFYPGRYGGGRGFLFEFSAVDSSSFEIEPCADHEFQCPIDGKCIPTYWTCEGPDPIVDCADNADEAEDLCADQPTPGECIEGGYQFVCDNGDCIHAGRRCDYRSDCADGSDEMECPCEGDHVFDCGAGDLCILDAYVCNWDIDCHNGADEKSCGSAETTDSRMLDVGQSMDFSSPNYPTDFGINVYYLFTFETDAGYLIMIDIHSFSISVGGYVAFGNGLDSEARSTAIEVNDHFDSPTSVISSLNRMWISIHGGPYGFGAFSASATSIENPCGEGQFRCHDGSCIDSQCDYSDDCPNGEDELYCGPCTDSQFTCQSGKCIPDYYVCNLYDNCPDLDDEVGCAEGKTANLVLVEGSPMQISNPSYPEPYPPHDTLFWSVRTSNPDHYIRIRTLDWDLVIDSQLFIEYSDYFEYVYPTNVYLEPHYTRWFDHRFKPRDFTIAVNRAMVHFYPGRYGGGRGFLFEFSAVDSSSFEIEPCADHEFQCPIDGKCIPTYWTCEGPDPIVDCADNADEAEDLCADQPTPGECIEGGYQFVCDNGDCIHAGRRCDYRSDCADGSDEMECPCEGDHVFDCGAGDLCILDAYVCNWDIDCHNGADEKSCGSAETTDSRMLNVGQSMDFSSPSYPTDFGINVYYLFTFETDAGYLIMIDIHNFSISVGGYVAFGNGLDSEARSTAIEVNGHFDSPTSVISSLNTMWISIHGGPYGFGAFYASATSIENPCDEGQFRCSDGSCIDSQCDYSDDCPNGEDELFCGPCTDSEFTCRSGKCIPDYYVCNLYDNCPDLDDEVGCAEGKTANLVLVEGLPMQISNPSYPEPYPPHDTLFWSVRTSNPDHYIRISTLDWDLVIDSQLFIEYSDYFEYVYPTNVYLEPHYTRWFDHRFKPRNFTIAVNRAMVHFYPGRYGGGRGFVFEFTAVDSSSFEIEPCADHEFQCPIDGKCIPTYWTCEGPDPIVDCADNADEAEDLCADQPTPGECMEGGYQFVCDNGDCIHAGRRCDYRSDCADGSDEMECPCEGDHVFDCGAGDLCILDAYVCNWDIDCHNGEDEKSCGSAETTDARMLNAGQSIDFSSPNYPNDFGINVYYLFTFETDEEYQIKIDIHNFSVSIGGYVAFGNGLDSEARSTAIEVNGHFDSPTSLTSRSNTMWISIHGGPYGFGAFYATATSVENPCEVGQFQCNDGTCVDGRCDYNDDCWTGEDELNCGPCEDDEFMCNNGKCIPSYYVCDFFPNCYDAEDERDCHVGRTENVVLEEGSTVVISNPTYPNPYPPHVNHYWNVTTENPDHYIRIRTIDFDVTVDTVLIFEYAEFYGYEYYLGIFYEPHYAQLYFNGNPPRETFDIAVNATLLHFVAEKYGGGRGFQFEITAIDPSAFVLSPCREGTFQCPIDGKCVPTYFTCESPSFFDCADGADEDEEYCSTRPTNYWPPAPGNCTGEDYEFRCDDGQCLHADFRCDHITDCHDRSDEVDCPCEGDNIFDCGPGDLCIPDFYVCNWDIDCKNGMDEMSCGSAETTEARTLNGGQSVNISSPNYPDDFGINVYYLFTFETDAGYQIMIDVYDFSVSIGGYVTFGNGLDSADRSTVIQSYSYSDSPTSLSSTSNTMWISIHGGPYGFGVFYASATSVIGGGT